MQVRFAREVYYRKAPCLSFETKVSKVGREPYICCRKMRGIFKEQPHGLTNYIEGGTYNLERQKGVGQMYVDVLFALNFMMDAMVLLAVSKLLKLRIGWRRLLLAAAVGALGGCMLTIGVQLESIRRIVVFQWMQTTLGEVLSGVLLCTVMTGIAFSPATKQGWVGNILSTYGLSFLLGGISSWLQQYVKDGHYFVIIATAFAIFLFGQIVFEKVRDHGKTICRVRVQMEMGTLEMQGLIDTGNLLTVPIVGTPVNVVWTEVILPGMNEKQRQQYNYICQNKQLPEVDVAQEGNCLEISKSLSEVHCWKLIPYRSVGCQGGLMPVLTVPRMYIQTEKQEIVINNALLGLCDHPVSGSKAYEIILNPKLINNDLKGD